MGERNRAVAAKQALKQCKEIRGNDRNNKELSYFNSTSVFLHYLMVAEESDGSMQWFHFFDSIFPG